MEYYTAIQLQSLIGGQVSFIVNQHSSELPYPPPVTLIFNTSDKRLISHHSITSETNIKVTKIEEIIANSRHFRL